MTEYMFVLGKNWVLSIAELIVCLENRGFGIKIVDHSRSIAVVDIDQELDDETVAEIQSALGGAFKIGKVIMVINRELVQRAYPIRGSFKKTDRQTLLKCPWLNAIWPRPRGKRIDFGVSTYPHSSKDNIDVKRFTVGLSEAMKQILMESGARRAAYYIYKEPDRRNPSRPNTALWPQTIAKHNLLHRPNAEVLVGITDHRVYISRTLAVYDSILQQYRDEARPFITTEISTSPKICRTLLNLAGLREGDTVLDPFCGTGTLLMEAAIQGIKVIGIDIDPDAVQGTKSNLKWIGRELGEFIEFQVIKGDARNTHEIVEKTVDGVATEPHLGPVYTERPSLEDARTTVRELTILYNEMLRSVVKVLREDGRIAMTLPVVISAEGPVRMDIRPLLRSTELDVYRLIPRDVVRPVLKKPNEMVLKPERERIPERKQGQIVQREIIMLGRA